MQYLRPNLNLDIMYNKVLFLSLVICIVCSCKNGQDNQQAVDWGDSKEHYLKGKGVTIKLPSGFVESSRYRIQEDVPALNNKSASVEVVQDALTEFERNDATIDVFVDTTSQYRFITILDVAEKIALDKSAAAKLGKRLMEDYEKMDLSKRGVSVDRIQSNIKKNNLQKLAKFKFEISERNKKSKTYVTSFFITNSTRTVIIHEFSDSKEDLEFYTWSLNENY